MKLSEILKNDRETTGATLNIFKTLVKLRVVESIVNPVEWATWYGVVRRFGRKYGN